MLEISHVTKRYGGKTAVCDVSLNAEAGRLVALLGPNGSGKTTLMKMIAGLVYIKTKDYQTLVELKDRLEHYMRDNKAFKDTVVQFDFNPMSGF